MSHQIDFTVKHIYDSREIGITLETTLRRGDAFVICDAKVDTGSEYCLFGREYAEQLGIEVETGFQQNLSTLTSGLSAYGHSVELETLEIKLDTFVYFAADYSLPRNLLGRQGWFQLINFGLNDYASEIYISPQDEEV